MVLLTKIKDFLFSLRTTLWLLAAILVMFAAGAIIMPAREEFQELHSAPLFSWLGEQELSLTWWLWCVIGLLVVLAVNTLCCSIESLVKKRKATTWLLLVSPQVIHVGFLFMLLAHLLSAYAGSQKAVYAIEGSSLRITDDTFMIIKDIDISVDYYGYVKDWRVAVEYEFNGKGVKSDVISPNNPSLLTGVNINVRDVRPLPRETVLIQVHRDPGAVWALVGGIVFTMGIGVLIVLRIKSEKR